MSGKKDGHFVSSSMGNQVKAFVNHVSNTLWTLHSFLGVYYIGKCVHLKGVDNTAHSSAGPCEKVFTIWSK